MGSPSLRDAADGVGEVVTVEQHNLSPPRLGAGPSVALGMGRRVTRAAGDDPREPGCLSRGRTTKLSRRRPAGTQPWERPARPPSAAAPGSARILTVSRFPAP